jgi:hypothetical protein
MAVPFNFIIGFLIQSLILSLICSEVHGWGWYNYTEATVYTNHLNGSVQNPGDKWTDFCDIKNNLCNGLFCDANQYLNEDWECVHSDHILYYETENYGFVYFHDDSPNYTITTKSQEYFKELKTRVNRNDSSVYVGRYDHLVWEYLQRFSRFMMTPFESDLMLFFSMDNSSTSTLVLIDYQCSLVNTKLRLLECAEEYMSKFGRNQWKKMNLVFTILSSISLFIVAIFYACIRELRINIIGKFVLVLAITDAIKMIANSLYFDTVSSFFYQFFMDSNVFWFLAMVYETFVLLKYYKIQIIIFHK